MTDQKVQTIDRTLDLLEQLATAKDGLGVTELGKAIGLHKSTVHRLLTALAARGYVEKDPKTSAYKLGLKLIEISGLFLKKLELKTEALPFMRRLAERESQPVHLAILDGGEVIYIEKVEPVNSIRMYSQIGRRIPVFCSAIGKVLLSGLAPEQLTEVLAGLCFKKFTEATLTDPAALAAAVQMVGRRGWAVDNEEHEPGIRCIAAPVYDYTAKMIAAISVSGDKRALSPERDSEIAAEVMETARAISQRMGYVKNNTIKEGYRGCR
ncbi:MAG: IclR family transcriptional regulator [Bacillota bacterium]|jgi:IclR family KDG regulon transcriptional repressor